MSVSISIFGDSISTYSDEIHQWNPPRYTVYYRENVRIEHGLLSVEDTWWNQVIQAMRGTLCVNDSFSGSRVTGRFPAVTSKERLAALKTKNSEPDVILIFIGYNDAGFGVQLRRETDSPNPLNRKWDPFVFEDAYRHMLRAIRGEYPGATIIYSTLMRARKTDDTLWEEGKTFAGTCIEDYSEIIREMSEEHCYLADLERTGIRFAIHDKTHHPTKEGHVDIARAWVQCLGGLGLLK